MKLVDTNSIFMYVGGVLDALINLMILD